MERSRSPTLGAARQDSPGTDGTSIVPACPEPAADMGMPPHVAEPPHLRRLLGIPVTCTGMPEGSRMADKFMVGSGVGLRAGTAAGGPA